MTNLVIDRGTNGVRKFTIGPRIMEGRRNSLLDVHNMLMTTSVQFFRCDSWLHIRFDHLQYIHRQTAGGTHLLNLRWPFDNDRHVPRFLRNRMILMGSYAIPAVPPWFLGCAFVPECFLWYKVRASLANHPTHTSSRSPGCPYGWAVGMCGGS